MNAIKAIETVFDGHRFRSRLEARWAVFFKEMGIEYQYELEGYELEGGLRYLPDFFLPKLSVHVEVKPNRELSMRDMEKLVRFAGDADQKLLLIVGTPLKESMYLLTRASFDNWEILSAAQAEEEVRDCFFESIEDWSCVKFGPVPMRRGWAIVYRTDPPAAAATHDSALACAAQARFEHGRSGN